MNVDYICCGDSAELMKTLPDESIDLVVTSPPYDNLRTYNGFCFDFEKIAEQLFRVIKWGGCIVWVISDGVVNGSETGTSFKQALRFMEIGFNLHDTMIWSKDACSFPDRTRYCQTFEYMFVFSKGKPKTINLIADKKNKWGGTNVHGTFRQPDGSLRERSTTWKEVNIKEYGVRNNVWNVPGEKNNKTGHPAVFPKRLAMDHIRSWSNEGDVVLEPFLGSGTTAVACIETGRHYIGFDISEEYVAIAKQRIEGTTRQLSFI